MGAQPDRRARDLQRAAVRQLHVLPEVARLELRNLADLVRGRDRSAEQAERRTQVEELGALAVADPGADPLAELAMMDHAIQHRVEARIGRDAFVTQELGRHGLRVGGGAADLHEAVGAREDHVRVVERQREGRALHDHAERRVETRPLLLARDALGERDVDCASGAVAASRLQRRQAAREAAHRRRVLVDVAGELERRLLLLPGEVREASERLAAELAARPALIRTGPSERGKRDHDQTRVPAPGVSRERSFRQRACPASCPRSARRSRCRISSRRAWKSFAAGSSASVCLPAAEVRNQQRFTAAR